jgi:hypothetical protein
LGIGPNPQSPIPNPQSPIPNPQLTNLIKNNKNKYLLFKSKNNINYRNIIANLVVIHVPKIQKFLWINKYKYKNSRKNRNKIIHF